jgi:hypothetical protein
MPRTLAGEKPRRMQFKLTGNDPNRRLLFNPSPSLPLKIRTEEPKERWAFVRNTTLGDSSVLPVSHTHAPYHRENQEEDFSDKVMRGGIFFLLFFSISFIAIVVIVLSIAFSRMASSLDKLDGNSFSAKVDQALTHVVGAAENAETISSNAVTMSILAREAAEQAQPQMLKAVNESTGMLHQMAAFSEHPAWTVSAASLG